MRKQEISKILFAYWVPVLCYLGLIWYVSNQSDPTPGYTLPFSDTLLHGMEYLILGWLLFRALVHTPSDLLRQRAFLFAFIFCIVYATLDEYHQSFIPERICSLADGIADAVGSFIGMSIYAIQVRFAHRIPFMHTEHKGM